MASPDVSTNWKNNLASLERRLNLLPAEARRRKAEIWTKGQDKQDRHLIRWIKKYILWFFLASLAPWREKKGWTSIEQASGTFYTGRLIRLLSASGRLAGWRKQSVPRQRHAGTSFPVLYSTPARFTYGEQSPPGKRRIKLDDHCSAGNYGKMLAI